MAFVSWSHLTFSPESQRNHWRIQKRSLAVADLRFFRGGGDPESGGAKLLFWYIFLENCMRMKKNWTNAHFNLYSRHLFLDLFLQAGSRGT